MCSTVQQDDLHTITTIAASKNFSEDALWINGKETQINGRGIAVLREIRAIAGDKYDEKTGELLVKKEDWPQYRVRISTVNTFPTGAGIGFVCCWSGMFGVYLGKIVCC